MSERPIMRPRRGAKPPSFLATALVFLCLLIVGSAITAVLLVPTSLEDFAVTTAIVMVFEATGWAIHALWRRMTRKRRRERLMG
jgi:hypothetical protein